MHFSESLLPFVQIIEYNLKWEQMAIISYINAKQKHLGCKKGEANQNQQLSDYGYIHSHTCNWKL